MSIVVAVFAIISSCSLVVNAQSTSANDNVSLELGRALRKILTLDIDKGFESIRGKLLSKQEDGTLVYEVAEDGKFEMHAESEYIFIREGSPMGFYLANYVTDTSLTNKSFQAFLEMGDPWPGSVKNPFTVEKDVRASKDGKLVYILYSSGLKMGIYTFDEKINTGFLIIGFVS